jgi:hypothetical protein
MPKYLNEIIKQSAVAVVGAAVVVFVMWFTMGGVMLMHPFFVVAVVLPVLFWVCVAAVPYLLGVRYLPAVVAAFVLGWFGFDALYKHTCGPDPRDVRVMKPMAEAISDYIVKHGVPESLRDISNLPYRLEGCERKQKNLEECYFRINKNKYSVELYLAEKIYIEIYDIVSKTGINYGIQKISEKKWKISDKAFSSNSSGVCNPMRQ